MLRIVATLNPFELAHPPGSKSSTSLPSGRPRSRSRSLKIERADRGLRHYGTKPSVQWSSSRSYRSIEKSSGCIRKPGCSLSRAIAASAVSRVRYTPMNFVSSHPSRSWLC